MNAWQHLVPGLWLLGRACVCWPSAHCWPQGPWASGCACMRWPRAQLPRCWPFGPRHCPGLSLGPRALGLGCVWVACPRLGLPLAIIYIYIYLIKKKGC
ncbi:hypothetical protein TorRG33x02_108960 [Trema orientale]|uniref:Transmembrane protein n=1 Tax=Trema orientale TaxID=63057 RepID=A0A2P5F6C4_TREOI|nr:hypothetical protein TorRG33x02_108960 [Trema orientale]